ncbi:SusC/RagA family TonB-linked outer membrane protein [Mucilaginibacter terrae]|uniref:SusC/RagA family TonB-linked outer membrane protein n=1 Tax=Mucilaginibacter terrae TaxID=1955052 RepID=UPI00362D8449
MKIRYYLEDFNKKHKRLFTKIAMLAFFITLFQITSLYAQKIEIKGTVTDTKGLPVIGASVKIKGTALGTVTKTSGAYAIVVSDKKSILVFSSIGFISEERLTGDNTVINIVLKDDKVSLSDVVIVGYGEQKKKLLSTAVSTVNARQIEDRLVSTPGQALAGLVAGVNVAQASGEPGAPPVIQVRGIGSIGAGNSPLFVVDGYPLNNPDNFNQINPADIESVQVLKDAAAAAIYGSRGGNGVIIVTTKKGTPGVTRFNFTVNSGIQSVAKKVDVLNAEQYIDYVKDAFKNGGRAIPVIYNDPSTLANTDWQNEIFRTAVQSNYTLSASGGTDKVRFNVSGAYYKQKGIVKATDYDRYTLRAGIESSLTKKLSLSFNIAPSYTLNDQTATGGGLNSATINGIGVNPAGVGGSVLSALLQPPILPVRNANGDYSSATVTLSGNGQIFNGNPYNPVAVLDLYKDRTTVGRLLSNTALTYEILKGLKFRTSFGFEGIITNRNWFVPSTLMTDNAPSANLSTPLIANVRARTTQATSYNYVSENTLSYNTVFRKNHNVSLLAGYSFQKNIYRENSQFGQSGTTTNSIVEYPTNAGVILGTLGYSDNALISIFGRANYSYRDKYLFSASVRSDGSSRFGFNKRYAVFPAFSAAWRIGEENFLQNVSLISELKLRASYGVTGNNNIGDYAAQAYASQINYIFGPNAGTQTFGFSPGSLPNPDLTWETNKQINLGLELGVLKDRIYLTVDAYRRTTSDLLLSRGVPAILGYATSLLSNIGEVRNDGLEFAVKTVNLTGKFKWTTDANIAFTKNKVISLSDDGAFVGYDAAFGFTNSIRVVPGQALSSFYGYRQIGVYRDAADVAASAKWSSGGSAPGDVKYEDVNGDGTINGNDITNIGNPLPKFTYGLTNRFSYDKFELSFLLQGSYGNKILNAADRYTNYFNGSFNVRTNALNRWRSAEDPGDGMTPRAVIPNPSSTTVASTRNIFDGSFMRIRNVTLGYTLPATVAKKLKISSARFFLTAENLYTFTNYFGYNPEINVWFGSNQPRYGVDQGTYPVAKTFSIGLNLNF